VCPSEIQRKLPEDATLATVAAVGHERATQLPPAGCLSYIDETTDAALAKRQHRVRRLEFELTQEGDGRNPWKLSHERGNASRLSAGAGHGNEHGTHLP
jgi:hypothetical protein